MVQFHSTYLPEYWDRLVIIAFLQWLGSLPDPCPMIINWFFQFVDCCRCYSHLLFSNCRITDKSDIVHLSSPSFKGCLPVISGILWVLLLTFQIGLDDCLFIIVCLAVPFDTVPIIHLDDFAIALFMYVLIPKSELMPRSLFTPRSQPMSSYLLYSSLVFHHSQAPISVSAKRLTQPRFPSLPCSAKTLTISTSQVMFLGAVTRWPCLIFRPQIPWWPEVKHIGRIILHWQSPFNSYKFYSPVPVSTPLTLTIPILLDPRSCDLSGLDYYSSVISLV